MSTAPATRKPKRAQHGRLRLKTETGSTYEIDLDALTWSRTPTPASGVLRTERGQVTSVQIPGIGEPAVILGPPITADSDFRLIVTSHVVDIEPDDWKSMLEKCGFEANG
jgi:hypothetical protein